MIYILFIYSLKTSISLVHVFFYGVAAVHLKQRNDDVSYNKVRSDVDLNMFQSMFSCIMSICDKHVL